MKAGVDFHLAFSPEREDPGNDKSKVKTVPKVVGGYTPACLERAVRFTRVRSTRSSPFPPAGWRKQPSCSRIFFGASISRW